MIDPKKAGDITPLVARLEQHADEFRDHLGLTRGLVLEAASALILLEKERDTMTLLNGMNARRANEAEDYALKLRAERDVAIGHVGALLDEHFALGQHESGEIEYCSMGACDAARTFLESVRGEKRG